MTTTIRNSTFGRLFGSLGSAIAVAIAVDAGRRPLARDLEALGIDSREFAKIRRF
ncbi:MAG TPA: hypothetical protein VGM46_12345 [Mesorhizobium sp.]|jgi:hypothetical protein